MRIPGKTYFVAYFNPIKMIRAEFAIPAGSREEARQIAQQEKRRLIGYRFVGWN